METSAPQFSPKCQTNLQRPKGRLKDAYLSLKQKLLPNIAPASTSSEHAGMQRVWRLVPAEAVMPERVYFLELVTAGDSEMDPLPPGHFRAIQIKDNGIKKRHSRSGWVTPSSRTLQPAHEGRLAQ